ncbi:MAG: ATP-binding cassette domain-containing protein, partial [bacterium]|nr:ATP-binding cassette domain-containing protein [bacterium]
YAGNNPPVLQNINFTINPGETIALMGKIGTGKTSLVNLIPHLYDVEDGMIFIDDEDINDISPATIREQTGFVPQETFLFSDTIKNNIIYGKDNFSDDGLVDKIIKTAGMDKEIDQFQDKFETLLGERGINLSGGQKQRLAIARAIITNPNILIFDDCFSSMDISTERLIMENLRDVLKNRTTIIISHRTSTIRMADRIIVLDQGQIAEHGTHEELLDKKGLYAELYHLEKLKEELENGGQ